MTMLDRMRRHRNWLKWSLALVVLTFVAFYIPTFLDPGSSAGYAPGAAVAVVDGTPITTSEFQRTYNSQLQMYRQAYGGNLDPAMLRQMGIERQVLQQLIDERAALAEADRLGLRASDAEVRERIVRLPAFQENGHFIGENRYRQVLRSQRPPLSPSEFEQAVRRAVVLDKLRTAVTGWMSVSDAEADQEYRRRNEKVKLQLVALTADKFREGIQPTDQEIASYFESNKEQFRLGEKRKIRFLTVDTQKVRERINVSPQDVERHYNANIQQYSTPEQVRASHILLKTEGKDEAAVRKQAEQLLAKVKAGGDFAALAKQFSGDEASRDRGGDLDFFPRGRMVPEFDQVAFSLEPGSISDLVKTQYGFHIIKVTEKRPGSTQPLDQVRAQIVEQIKWERAQQQAEDLARRMEAEIDEPSDMERAARANGLKVQESGFFQRDEPVAGIGPSPEVSTEVFAMKEGTASDALRTPGGYAIVALVGKQEPRLPKLDEVKDRVREAVIQKKAVDAARAKAQAAVASLKGAADFEAAAKAAGLEVQKTEDFVARGAPLPGIGVNAKVEAAVFDLQPGAVTDPIVTDNAVTIAKVVERQDVTPDAIAKGRETLRDEMLNERRGRFFSSYMNKARERMEITINREALQRVVV